MTDVVYIIMVDTTVPVVTGETGVLIELGDSILLNWTANDLDPGTYVISLGGIIIDSGVWENYVMVSITAVGEIVGPYEYLAEFSDGSGNSITLTTTVTVLPSPDPIPPETVLTIEGPVLITDKVYITAENYFILTATDDESGVYLTNYIVLGDGYSSGWLIYSDPFTLAGLAVGDYIIAFNSTDNAGNVENTIEVAVTLFDWDYIYSEHICTGDIILKIDTDFNLFQFISPDRDYGIREASRMIVSRHVIIIHHKDNELRLVSIAIDFKRDTCFVIARDLETGERYFLIGRRISGLYNLNSPIYRCITRK